MARRRAGKVRELTFHPNAGKGAVALLGIRAFIRVKSIAYY
jgi:hypothetical protein